MVEIIIFPDILYQFGSAAFSYPTSNYVTCSGKLGNMLQQQVAHLVGIMSAGYFYLIQSELAYLKAVELPFSN